MLCKVLVVFFSRQKYNKSQRLNSLLNLHIKNQNILIQTISVTTCLKDYNPTILILFYEKKQTGQGQNKNNQGVKG